MKGLFIFFIGLLLMVGILYYSIVYVKEEQQRIFNELAELDSTFTLEKPPSELDSLKLVLQEYQDALKQKEDKIDSLGTANESKDKIVAEHNKVVDKKQQREAERQRQLEQAKTMAKTFEKMKVGEISPILRNLDDDTVMLIYKETSNRFKKNILLAINEKRAAVITKDFITKN